MSKKLELAGSRFTRLTVISEAGRKNGSVLWECVCDCGNTTKATSGQLRYGHKKSCGCLHGSRHGKSNTRLYHIWKNMIGRCYRKSSTHYHRYGGRGIKVCDDWRNDYIAFEKWALENGYSDTLTIDRIDVDGDYTPNNCRFISGRENTQLMNIHHIANKTGGHSKQAKEKLKERHRKNLGRKIRVYNDTVEYTFCAIREAAEFMSTLLNRSYESCRVQLGLVLNENNVCKTISGYKVEDID